MGGTGQGCVIGVHAHPFAGGHERRSADNEATRTTKHTMRTTIIAALLAATCAVPTAARAEDWWWTTRASNIEVAGGQFPSHCEPAPNPPAWWGDSARITGDPPPVFTEEGDGWVSMFFPSMNMYVNYYRGEQACRRKVAAILKGSEIQRHEVDQYR
jgi:hypothetical protein